MAGDEDTLASLWHKADAEVQKLVSMRQGGVSSVEDFTVDRVCACLEKLRQEAKSQSGPEENGPVNLRSEIAIEEHRHQVLQEMIDETTASLKAAQQSREELQQQLNEVVQSGPTFDRQQLEGELQKLQAELVATQEEVRQVEDETASLVAERQRVEQLIAEAEHRQGATNGRDREDLNDELQRIAGRASDTKYIQPQLQDFRAGGATSATAAFLNSNLGRGPGAKTDLSKGSFHSSGGLQYLASRSAGGEMQAGQVGTSGYALTADVFDTIQERLAVLREKCDTGARTGEASRAPQDAPSLEGGNPKANVMDEAKSVLQKMTELSNLRNAVN